MKKALRILAALLIVVLACGAVYLTAYLRPKMLRENEQLKAAAAAAETERIAQEEAEAAAEAARDHREYVIYFDSTGNDGYDAGIEKAIDEVKKDFQEKTSKENEDKFAAMVRTFVSEDHCSVLMHYMYLEEEGTKTFFVSKDGNVLSNAEGAGENYRTYLSDYLVANARKIDSIKEVLTENWKDCVADEEGNLETFVILEDDTVNVYFAPRTLTTEDKTLILNIPANVLTGEYYDRRRIDPDKPMVAVTYDDGPNDTTYPQILDILEANNAVATFFDVGVHVDEFPEMTGRAYKMGCEIGSHTYRHINLPSAYKGLLDSDKAASDEAFLKATGTIPTLCRPPEGSIGGSAKFYYDYTYIGWSIDTLDWYNRNVGAIIYNVQSASKLDGQVILMHSIYDCTVTASQTIIPWLIEQGYQLVTISELLEYYYDIPDPELHVYYAVDFFLYGKEAV